MGNKNQCRRRPWGPPGHLLGSIVKNGMAKVKLKSRVLCHPLTQCRCFCSLCPRIVPKNSGNPELESDVGAVRLHVNTVAPSPFE